MKVAAENIQLPSLTNFEWELSAASVAERNELLDYAASKGVPVWPAARECDSDALLLGWLGDLMVYEAAHIVEEALITPEQFKAMCDAYAA